ncbi:eukaryotic translation initiation factor 3 subunit G-like [Papaver somniferum]|uniref:eukaryotic translation initiation factor 3 subunit G-like n=1 Tax=Papaver somniferum TaxID=3469 RepID=UPI000E6F7FDA|nr:eukaryotic translation initiation factor 3 subunit G-like [Papaver somniferum]
MTTSTQKLKWGDLEDEDGNNLDFLLPPPEVIGPDKNSIKKVISYKYNEEGLKVKVTTTSRVTRKVIDTRKSVAERRSWPKFGEAADEDDKGYTTKSNECIFLERPTAPGEEPKQKEIEVMQKETSDGQLMLCRICKKKGDHWTAKCPYKGLAPNLADANTTTEESDSKLGSKKYVPPRPDAKRRDDENSVRVSNLSEDAGNQDLEDLFRRFGPLTRAHVVFDRQTGKSRGFGFVNFVNKEDADRAVAKLNGYGYDSLILEVELAGRRSKVEK